MCRCPGENHPTFGACVRSKNLRVAYCNSASGRDATAQKTWDKDLAAYADARRQGIQPESTRRGATDEAVKQSDRLGTPYGALS